MDSYPFVQPYEEDKRKGEKEVWLEQEECETDPEHPCRTFQHYTKALDSTASVAAESSSPLQGYFPYSGGGQKSPSREEPLVVV